MEVFVTRWMDLESVIQSEVSQKEKNKYHMLTHIYGILKKKMVLMNVVAGQKLRHRCREWTYVHQGGKTAVRWGWWCAELGDWD